MAGLDPAIHGPRARHRPRGYPAHCQPFGMGQKAGHDDGSEV